MPISNEDYAQAMAVIAQMETATLNALKESLEGLLTEVASAKTDLVTTRGTMPAVSGTLSNGKNLLDTAINQVETFRTQLSYLITSVDQTILQYPTV